jgi:hypothetical protein
MNGIANTAGWLKKIKTTTSIARNVSNISIANPLCLWYERYSSYCRTIEKMKNNHPQVPQVPHVQQV